MVICAKDPAMSTKLDNESERCYDRERRVDVCGVSLSHGQHVEHPPTKLGTTNGKSPWPFSNNICISGASAL